ncbi:hypothetical protein SPH9361_02825 [Sphingobium sp. CECT 9361]|nr:hypothetical protein SPH9361_02825 [Sphingobium sp. CECT 9361]
MDSLLSVLNDRSGASGGRGRVKDREATAKRRWGSRFSWAATDAEGEALRLIRRRKWWGPAVLEAVSGVRHNGKSVRDVSSRRETPARRSGVRTDWSAWAASEPELDASGKKKGTERGARSRMASGMTTAVAVVLVDAADRAEAGSETSGHDLGIVDIAKLGGDRDCL